MALGEESAEEKSNRQHRLDSACLCLCTV